MGLHLGGLQTGERWVHIWEGLKRGGVGLYLGGFQAGMGAFMSRGGGGGGVETGQG